jgi:hypothetical protein
VIYKTKEFIDKTKDWKYWHRNKKYDILIYTKKALCSFQD